MCAWILTQLSLRYVALWDISGGYKVTKKCLAPHKASQLQSQPQAYKPHPTKQPYLMCLKSFLFNTSMWRREFLPFLKALGFWRISPAATTIHSQFLLNYYGCGFQGDFH